MNQDSQAMAIRQALGVERLAEHLWRSGYWNDARSQSQAIVKILRGAELDIGPISSMDGVYVIEGKTTLNATLLGSLIQRSDRYRYRVVEHDDSHCVIDFFEIVDGKREKLGTSKFDMEDAKKADLLNKKMRMWEKFPRNMVFSRALSNGARWYTPDIFNGPVYVPEELGLEVDQEGNVVEGSFTPIREREAEDAPRKRVVERDDERVWKRWLEIRDDALKFGVPFEELQLPMEYEPLVSAGLALKAKVEAKQAQLDQEEAARAAARAALPAGTLGPQPPLAWERNRALQAEAYMLGIHMPELPSRATEEEIVARNAMLQSAISEVQQSQQSSERLPL